VHFCLGISILFSVALLVVRFYQTGDWYFTFLIWNLFLAGLPLLASTAFKYLHAIGRLTLISGIAILGFWLLFLPNAPYILTDLFHLKQRPNIPIWFDLILILSFAWNGLLFAFISLLDVQDIVTKRSNKYIGWGLVLFAIVASSFGIYLGRFLRWNSWDVLQDPGGLLTDITDRILNPLSHLTTTGVTIGLSAFLLLGYLTIRALIHQKSSLES
jgi:uncharacterized membrane protein